MYDICSAVLAINPNAQVSVTGEDYDKIISGLYRSLFKSFEEGL